VTGPTIEERSARLLEVRFPSPALERDTSLRILRPANGDGTVDRLPVLWLLHGGNDDFRSWTDKGRAEELTAGLPLVVVMPDCSPFGWYSDWTKETSQGPQRWETTHLDELRPWVESTFTTRTDRAGRAIVGLSMGGFGAMSYAARHPDLFGFAASFSGALDSRDRRLSAVIQWSTGEMGGMPGDIWGDPVADASRWQEHNPTDRAQELRTVEVHVRTGDGKAGGRHGGGPDEIEAGVHRASTTFHRRLVDLGIDHEFTEGHGVHDWPYWQDDLAATLPRIMDRARTG